MDRKARYLMIDTETSNGFSHPCPYDIGMRVINNCGGVYEELSHLTKDIFEDNPEMMQTAYYANKIPLYYEKLQNGEIDIQTWQAIFNEFIAILRKYNIKAVIAHNARFDYRACNTLNNFIFGEGNSFFPEDIEIWDTMRMAKDVICTKPTYIKWCQNNGYITKGGKPRATAEILYRFISGDNDFTEAHTALEDAKIESVIFWYCIKQKKKMTRKIF